MIKEEENIEDQNIDKRWEMPSIKKALSYKWITQNIAFFLFVAFLAVLYIANGHKADKTVRDISKTTQEIKELEFEYKTLKSELIYKSRETELVKSVESLGLKVQETPAVRIKSLSSKEKK
ncbi:MAG: hypothetical protein LBE82_03350 [Chitinophagaceae bacterium]|jgi:cell division protein FtsL|nr:hypothetical protein [Chitinophagaceae bacterium]